VLLMSGAAQSSGFWYPVVVRMEGRLVASYDRPGMGGTPWPGHLPTLEEEVDTAADLVRRLGAPVVLAAHSMAAFHAEALIREHPDLVSGLVLVDPSVEWQAGPPAGRSIGLARIVRWAAQNGLAGLGRLSMAMATESNSVRSPERLRNYTREHGIREVYSAPDALAMATAEVIGYDRQAWELMTVRSEHEWPGTPTILLSAELSYGEQAEATQERLAKLLGAQMRLVAGSRHLVMLDDPGAIVTAVSDLS
jgi:pimeloyl-ACP methyl ester carboxylesterase